MTLKCFADFPLGSELPGLDYTPTVTEVVSGALASRDYARLHHDVDFVRDQAGHPHILMNTPHQQALFERYLYACCGEFARLGRMRLAMKRSLYADQPIRLHGTVTAAEIDDRGCAWLSLTLSAQVNDDIASECLLRVAVPQSRTDNPWQRRGEEWQP